MRETFIAVCHEILPLNMHRCPFRLVKVHESCKASAESRVVVKTIKNAFGFVVLALRVHSPVVSDKLQLRVRATTPLHRGAVRIVSRHD